MSYVGSLVALGTYCLGVKMNEKTIVDSIKQYLSSVPNLFYWKEPGIPDIIVCYKGKFIAFECKRPGGKPTLLQKITLNKIEKAKGIAKIVTSVEQVKEVIEKI